MRYSVRVVPNAKKPEVIQLDQNSLKVKVDAQPEEGKANKRLIEILADYFKLKKNRIFLISGEKSRNKVIEIQ